MKYVLDAAVSLKWMLPEPDSAEVLRLCDDFHDARRQKEGPSILRIDASHFTSPVCSGNQVPLQFNSGEFVPWRTKMTEDAADSPVPIDLNLLGEEPGLPALTCVAGRFLAESAAVCLDQQGHVSGASLTVSGLANARYLLLWPEVTEQMRRTYNDLQEATEDGAYGIAILLVGWLTGFTVVERSRKGTGIDYWLGPESDPPFQNKARLEVSGILEGTDTQITARLNSKKKQSERSADTGMPAYIVIIEYSRPHAETCQQ